MVGDEILLQHRSCRAVQGALAAVFSVVPVACLKALRQVVVDKGAVEFVFGKALFHGNVDAVEDRVRPVAGVARRDGGFERLERGALIQHAMGDEGARIIPERAEKAAAAGVIGGVVFIRGKQHGFALVHEGQIADQKRIRIEDQQTVGGGEFIRHEFEDLLPDPAIAVAVAGDIAECPDRRGEHMLLVDIGCADAGGEGGDVGAGLADKDDLGHGVHEMGADAGNGMFGLMQILDGDGHDERDRLRGALEMTREMHENVLMQGGMGFAHEFLRQRFMCCAQNGSLRRPR